MRSLRREFLIGAAAFVGAAAALPQTAPIADAQRTRNLAEKRLADAKKAKTDADKAAVDEAAKTGCKAHCASMLLAAQNTANAELAAARAAYEAAKIPESTTALAANLGVTRKDQPIDVSRWICPSRRPRGHPDANGGEPCLKRTRYRASSVVRRQYRPARRRLQTAVGHS